MTVSWPERSAYLRPAVLERWDDAALAGWASAAADAGVTAVLTKLDAITPRRREVLGSRGMSVIGSFSCYSDHRHPDALPGGVRPVGRDGRALASMEWYTGLVPGSDRYDDALTAQLGAEAAAAETEWVLLDFLRWPGHWELESRDGASPREASFDPLTLTRFAAAQGQATASVADVDAHPAEWEAFRTRTITDRAARLAAVVREAGARPGMFLVPVEDLRRRRDYGQDAASLAPHVDLFALMSYQQMLGLTADAVLALADEAAAASERPVVAMLQTSASAEYSDGWDWGPPVTASEAAALAAGLDAATRAGRVAGTCFFPGEAPVPHTNTPRGRS